jgi:Ca-activated chloride channel family protein
VFEFGWPWAFWLLPLLIIWLLPAVKQKRAALAVPFFKNMVTISGQKADKGVNVARRRILQSIFMALVWILLVIAMASPQIVGEPDLKVKTARNFLMALDLSGSMLTTDWEIAGQRVSRWEAVKTVMGEFIERREGDRLGLVFFGSQAYLQVPFTSDLETIHSMLQETEVGMAGEQTALGNAIGLGIKLFQADTTVDSRVMLLLTDGVDSGSDIKPIQAARTAALDSIVIYTIGIGDPNSSAFDLDEQSLQEIAAATGGRYFLAIDRPQLEQVYQTLNQLEPIEFEEETYRPATLLYYWPLAGAFVLAVVFHLFRGLAMLIRNQKTGEVE